MWFNRGKFLSQNRRNFHRRPEQVGTGQQYSLIRVTRRTDRKGVTPAKEVVQLLDARSAPADAPSQEIQLFDSPIFSGRQPLAVAFQKLPIDCRAVRSDLSVC